MLNSQHGAVIDDPGSHEQLPEVLHLKAIIASHHGITIQSNDQLQVFRILHLGLRLQRPKHQSPTVAMVGRRDKAAASKGGGVV